MRPHPPDVRLDGELSLQQRFRRHPSYWQLPLSLHLIVVGAVEVLGETKVADLDHSVSSLAGDQAVTSSYISGEEKETDDVCV